MRIALAGVIAAFFTVVALSVAGCDRTNEKGSPSETGISRSDIAFLGMQLRRDRGDGSYQAVGRLSNRSRKHALREVVLTFTMEDVAPAGDSTIIASTTLPMRYEVPPGQSAHFRERISFGSLPKPKGRYEWNYSIAAINGVGVLPERERSR